MKILAACSLKSGGTSTLVLALAGALAAARRPVRIIDMSRNRDLLNWAEMRGRPRQINVAPARTLEEMERQIVLGLREKEFVLIDSGIKPERIRDAARHADMTLIPVRFSPLSAYWATQTAEMLRACPQFTKPRSQAFVATAVTPIPSRIARAVEARIEKSRIDKLSAGLALRAAQEAPFLYGGTVFSLSDDAAPGIKKACIDSLGVAQELGLLNRPSPARTYEPAPAASRPAPCVTPMPPAAHNQWMQFESWPIV